MLTKTRMGFAGLTAAFAALLARSGFQQASSIPPIGSRGKSAPSAAGVTVWASTSKGTFAAGRNAAKRAAKAHQHERRAAQVRNAGLHQGSNVPLGHRDAAPKMKFSARRDLLADRRLRQRAG